LGVFVLAPLRGGGSPLLLSLSHLKKPLESGFFIGN
jgi:hypothetical protein